MNRNCSERDASANNGWRDKVVRLLFSHDPEIAEMLCAWWMLLYSVWLLRPEVQLAQSSMRWLSGWKTLWFLEDAFGVCLLLLSLVQGASVIASIRGEWDGQDISRAICRRSLCAMAAFLSWFLLLLVRVTVSPMAPDAALIPVILGANAWIYIRLGVTAPEVCVASHVLSDIIQSPLDASSSPELCSSRRCPEAPDESH